MRRARSVVTPRLQSLAGEVVASLFQPVQNRIEIQPAAVSNTVDKQTGSCIDSVHDATAEIFAHPLLVHAVLEFSAEPLGVQPQLLRIPIQIFARKSGLMSEQKIVHLPEVILGAGCFGRFRRLLSARMRAGEWVMAENQADVLTKLLANFTNCPKQLAAGGALIVAILDKRVLSLRRAFHMVVRLDG